MSKVDVSIPLAWYLDEVEEALEVVRFAMDPHLCNTEIVSTSC